ncbi:hypothetical protein PVL29_017490 [Vitis rotundifolia]|uniref:Beta-Casp domain-containing protein n=1 Tax=Vitis rotundifolia TaxID=103349 RepID=A0AA38ZAK5_VITRO|nr:hypothetical protein PVL29_017490 [Vitis rotundifolia]
MERSLVVGCPCIDDVKGCMQKVHTLKYAQEVCYNGTLIIEAVSSGLEIGTCNWTINGPKRNIACLSSSIFNSSHAMNFDYHALQGNDLIIYSDLSSPVLEDVKDNSYYSAPTSQNSSTLSADNDQEASAELLLSTSESLEEMEKLNFICSCIIDSVKAGGSVLIPIGRLGIILQLLELISLSLEASSLKVPIFIISSVAEELLAFTNIIPEWLCKQRQEKLFSGEPFFAHAQLIKEKKLHVFPAVHSPNLLKIWQEPCIVFSPHWSLRLGPVVHLLRRWRGDENSLLIMEEGVDAGLALLPFKPMAMKVLQCSFLSGIKLQKVQPLLKILQPKFVLFPEDLRQLVSYSDTNSPAFFYYCENETLRVPSLKNSSELEIAADSVSLIHCRRLTEESLGIGRLKGEFSVTHGKHQLRSGSEQADSSQSRPPLLHWGSLDLERLLAVLEKMGIRGSVEQGNSNTDSENAGVVHVYEPNKALIEVRENSTIISASNESLSSLIFEAVDGILSGL